MTTLATLRSDIKTFANREDLSDPQIDAFIRIAEGWIRRDVRVAEQIVSDTLSVSSQTTALPAGVLALRSVSLSDPSTPALDFLSPERLRESIGFFESGRPRAYTVEGDNLVVLPAPSETYTLNIVYWKAFDALSAADDTNGLLQRAYDLYLYGGLAVLYEFIQDSEKEAEYRAKFDRAVSDVMRSERRKRYSGSALISTGVSGP